MSSGYRSQDINLSWKCDEDWTIGQPISFYIFIIEVYPNVIKKCFPKGDLNLTYTETPIKGKTQYFENHQVYLDRSKLGRTKMTLKAYEDASISNLPSSLTLCLRHENKVIESIRLEITANMFLDYIFTLGPFKKKDDIKAADIKFVDILLFGLAGSGKSSFINSVFTAVNKTNIPIVQAIAGGHEDRVTTALKSWSLPRLKDNKLSCYRLWDTWGLEPDNYQGCEFKKILLGEVSTGWEMEKAVIESEFDISDQVDPFKKKKVVIFFVEAGAFDGDPNDDSNVLILRQKMNQVTKTGIHSIVALSKADLVGYDIEDNSKFEEYRVKAANFFNLGKNQVFPLITYANIEQKNFEIDRLILNVAIHAFHCAKILPTNNNNKNVNNNNSKSEDDEDNEWMFNL